MNIKSKHMPQVIFLILMATLFLNACNNNAPQNTVSYKQDIQPMLKQHCSECHSAGGAGSLTSGLKLTSYQDIMLGTKFGPVIKAGDSISSTLVILVEGRADTSINMPHGNRPSLSDQEALTLRQWIDEGAKNN
jgi:uncharacterized membrane protein